MDVVVTMCCCFIDVVGRFVCFVICIVVVICVVFFFFFNDTATTEIYTLSLHDALPICTCDIVFLTWGINFVDLKFWPVRNYSRAILESFN